MLYAYVLQKGAQFVRQVGRPGYAKEYESRAECLQRAIRTHCYDGRSFTDSTVNMTDELSYSQHCPVFAILSGAAMPEDRGCLLTESHQSALF